MDGDAIVGCVTILVALSTIIYLTLWSRRAIDRIADRAERSAREIVRDLKGD